MFLKSIHLQNFRNYSKADFELSSSLTIVVGSNTAGKTNLMEAIYFLSTGKSFKGVDKDLIKFGKDLGRIKADLDNDSEPLEIIFSNIGEKFIKKYLVNGVSRQRVKFVGHFPTVLFTPEDLNLVGGSPSIRRNYMDYVLEQMDQDYRRALLFYEKGLRARNKLLDNAKETGVRNDEEFEYWDNIVINNGNIITRIRENFLEFVNNAIKDVFQFTIIYDKSIISKERLLQYKDAEMGSGVTLVGPHRDDLIFRMPTDKNHVDLKIFGSRGQQRLCVLQLKRIELEFLNGALGMKPLLLLDDIFSELDEKHIEIVLEMTHLPTALSSTRISTQQTIITTTHKEFIGQKFLEGSNVIELGK